MNYFKKNIILISGIFIAIFVCYILALSPTLELNKKHNQLTNQNTSHQNTLKKLTQLEQQSRYYDQVLETYKISSDASIQNNLLEIINSYNLKNNIKIISFNEPHFYKENTTIFSSYSFKIRGTYTKIIKLIYLLEQKYKFGKVSSSFFEKNKNYRTHKTYLDCEIFLQRIEQ